MRKSYWVIAGLLAALATPRPVWSQAPVVTEQLTMEQAVDLALKHHPELQSVGEAVRREEAAAVPGSPTAGANVVPFGLQSALPTIFETVPQVQTLPVVTTPLFDQALPLSNGSRVQRQVAADLMGSEGSQDELRKQVIDLMRNTREKWLEALLAGEQQVAYSDIVSKETEANDLAQHQFQSGDEPEVVVYRAKVDLASRQQELNNAKCESDKALMNLKVVLGVDQASDITLNGKLNDQPAPLPDRDWLVQAALRQRPDVEKARFDLDRAELESHERNAGAATEQKVASLRSQLDDISQVVKCAVYVAYADVQTQVDNLNLTSTAIDDAEKNFSIAELRFKTGKGIQLEIIDALTALGQARVNRLQAECGYERALVELNWAVGGVVAKL